MNKKKTRNMPTDDYARGSGAPSPVDIHVGHRLRERRGLLGFSQEKLAETVGLTFQQIQKYERGTNRISASRLYQFSKVLDVPVSFFYENYRDNSKTPIPRYNLSDNGQEAYSDIDMEIMNKKETLELIRVYYSITDPKIRKDLFKMIRNMAENMKRGA